MSPLTGKSTLVLGGVLVGVLLFEGTLRWIVPDRFVYRNPWFEVSAVHPEDAEQQMADPTFGAVVRFVGGKWRYHLKRNLRARFTSSDFDVSFETNAHGLRGPPLREKATHRILGLGDSFAMGYGVELEEMYLSHLGVLLDPGSPVESLSAGVVGYNPYNSFHYLLGPGFEFKPDLVIMQLWVGDDLCGGSGPGRPWGQEHATLQRKAREWAGSFHVAMFARERLRSLASFRKWAMDRRLITGFRADEILRPGFAERCARPLATLADMFKRARQASEAAGARFVLLLIPLREQVYNGDLQRSLAYNFSAADPASLDVAGPNHAFRESAERVGVEYVDLLEPFLNHDPSERLYFCRSDPHMTPAGHRLAARVLVDHLASVTDRTEIE